MKLKLLKNLISKDWDNKAQIWSEALTSVMNFNKIYISIYTAFAANFDSLFTWRVGDFRSAFDLSVLNNSKALCSCVNAGDRFSFTMD